MNEPIVVDYDRPPGRILENQPVIAQLPDVPPRAVSNGWGDMRWATR